MNICVYGASSREIDEKYVVAGEKLGEEMAKRGITLIFGAGASGMMGAAARGITKGGGKSVGIAPSFFNVDGVLYDKCTELIRPETMKERKTLLRDMSDGYIVTAGGIGTMDELFEVLTLKQLGRDDKPIVVLNTSGFYNGLNAMLKGFIEEKAVSDKIWELFFVTEDVNEALDYIEKYEKEFKDPRNYKFY